MSEEYELYYDADAVLDVPENEGLPPEGVEPLLHGIREAGASYQVVDVSDSTREQLEDAYASKAVPPSVRRQYSVKRVFGTNKYSGSRFGRGVPALVVLEDGRPIDVYPHEKDGQIVTIEDYVKGLTGGDRAVSGAELARRMDCSTRQVRRRRHDCQRAGEGGASPVTPATPRRVVLDASVALKWQLPDDDHIPQALALRDDFLIHRTVRLVAPSLFLYEIRNAIGIAARRARVSADVADEALANLLACDIEVFPPDPERILRLCRRFAVTSYDAAYVALALQLRIDLWTGDHPLFQTSGKELASVRWIGDYPLPA